MIVRTCHLHDVEELLNDSPLVGLIGAREFGKTTLAQEILKNLSGRGHFFDLVASKGTARLSDPLFALGELTGLVILDVIHAGVNAFPLEKGFRVVAASQMLEDIV